VVRFYDLESAESRPFIAPIRTVPMFLLSFLLAAREARSAEDTVRWTEVLYLFSHCVIDFMRYARQPHERNLGREHRVDAPLLHWLLAVLEAERAAAEPDSARQEPLRSPHASADPSEIWIWKRVAGAYALLLGSGRAQRPRQVEACAFIGDLLCKWEVLLATGSGLQDSHNGYGGKVPWRCMLDKIDWLQTDEGLEFVREVCSDMTLAII
jgi:hypothetical protein